MPSTIPPKMFRLRPEILDDLRLIRERYRLASDTAAACLAIVELAAAIRSEGSTDAPEKSRRKSRAGVGK